MPEAEYRFDSQEDLEEITQMLGTGSTIRTGVRGPELTDYNLEPRVWLKQIVDAAQKRFLYGQTAYQTEIPKGAGSIFIPRRDIYLASGSWADDITPGASSDITFTRLTNLSGVGVSASFHNKAVAVAYDVIQTNLLDVVRHAQEELVHICGDLADIAVVTAYIGATASTSTLRGAQTIYGGDATQALELVAGDTISTDLVSEGIRKLKSTTCKYWTAGTGESNSSAGKNGWPNENDFVLLVSPFEEEIFRDDAQFTNAAQYGGREVIMSGEIGEYLGVKIIVSNNTKEYSASTKHRDGTISTVATNCCVMTKAQKGAAFAYSVKPKLTVFDYPRQLETDLIIEQAYGTGIIHDDAIVWVSVAQE